MGTGTDRSMPHLPSSNGNCTTFLLFRDQRVTEQWQNSIGLLEYQLTKIDTPPILANTIVQQLLHWRDPSYNPEGTQHVGLVQAQTVVGWRNFLYGQLSPRWQQAHAQLLPSENNHKSKRWTIQIIKKLWNVAWDLWEHRNGIRHDPLHPWKIAEAQSLKEAIRLEFRIGTATLLAQDRHRLYEGPQYILHQPIETQQQWIRSIHAARASFVASQQNMMEEEQPSPVVTNMRIGLRDWLHGTPNGDP